MHCIVHWFLLRLFVNCELFIFTIVNYLFFHFMMLIGLFWLNPINDEMFFNVYLDKFESYSLQYCKAHIVLRFCIYESGDFRERKLNKNEKPLNVQSHWSSAGHYQRFVLRRATRSVSNQVNLTLHICNWSQHSFFHLLSHWKHDMTTTAIERNINNC